MGIDSIKNPPNKIISMSMMGIALLERSSDRYIESQIVNLHISKPCWRDRVSDIAATSLSFLGIVKFFYFYFIAFRQSDLINIL